MAQPAHPTTWYLCTVPLKQPVTGREHDCAAHLAGQGDAEGLGAEHLFARERDDGGVDGHGQLHGQLGGDDAGDDHDAVEDELEAIAVRVLHV